MSEKESKKGCKKNCGCDVDECSRNTFLGTDAGKGLKQGNTAVGWKAGSSVLNPSEVEGAVLLGSDAGKGVRVPKKSLFVHKELAPSGGHNCTPMAYNAKSGQVVPAVSSLRFKENVRTLEVDSAQIYNLVPHTFEYKPEYGGTTDFGYIAEEVESILPEILTFDELGPYSARYDIISVLLVKELKALRDRVVTLETSNTTLQGQVATLQSDVSTLQSQVATLQTQVAGLLNP